jgi:DNA-binding transcriptional ArsR family regulator
MPTELSMPFAPEPVRPIRALLRGLQALSVLDPHDGLSVSEAARRAKLPRTTVYRILETLRQGGYVARDDSERYITTAKAGQLLDGHGRGNGNGNGNGAADDHHANAA